MIYATRLIVVFILSQTTINVSDFPVNIWVASFMVCAFQDQPFFNQVYTKTPVGTADSLVC